MASFFTFIASIYWLCPVCLCASNRVFDKIVNVTINIIFVIISASLSYTVFCPSLSS
ncbi:hypothetical protein Barb6_02353 [Bacteroidales bacterium Barb6]|nr:hypothetical protein Barb6_02353 [Bacteroidales bacterium Barb6]